ncbi:glutaredoxin family protein [candidate division KSB1 bacterium]
MKSPPLPRVRFYTKKNCSLCLAAHNVIQKVAGEIHFDLEVIDITSEKSLYREYIEKIPVIYINDNKIFQYFINENLFREALERCISV